MKKLLSAVLALVLTFSLAAPALAYEDTDPPMWQLCLSPSSAKGEDISLERCLGYTAMTEEEYAAMAEWCARYQKEHADEWAAFDPDAYQLALTRRLGNPPETQVSDKAGWGGEQGFADYLRYDWLRKMYLAYEENRAALEMAERYPEDYAAFDADAWFPGGADPGHDWSSKAAYMETEGLATEEEFHMAMFRDWVKVSASQPKGITITVDGELIRGWPEGGNVAYPYDENQRILVTTPALTEPLGMTVERDPENRFLTCTKGDVSVTFTDGECAYTVTRDGNTEIRHLDVPPKAYYKVDGHFYVPLRALVEALGCTVTWNGPFHTAAITTGSN